MNNSHQYSLLPLSARNAHSLPVRQHSLPAYKQKQNHKIKINLKRLPNDFFKSPSSQPQITPLTDFIGKFRAKTHQTCRFHRNLQPKSMVNIERKTQFLLDHVKERGYSPQTQKTKRTTKTNFHSEPTHENSNTLNFNWTFSKKLFQQKKEQKSQQIGRSCIPRDILDSSKTMMAKTKPNEEQCGVEQGKRTRQNVTSLLTQKICQLNINRLKKNVRKNNHPQSYLQYIKKQCN